MTITNTLDSVEISQWFGSMASLASTVLVVMFLFKWIPEEKEKSTQKPSRMISVWLLFACVINAFIVAYRFAFFKA